MQSYPGSRILRERSQVKVPPKPGLKPAEEFPAIIKDYIQENHP